MPLAPVVVGALQAAQPLRSKALWLDGLDLNLAPGSPGNKIGTLLESVTVTEAGPGQVSSMTFTVEDPLAALPITFGQFVWFQDITRDIVIFSGFVYDYEIQPQSIGRLITVQVTGVEGLLDWITIGANVTIPAGTDAYAAVQGLMGVTDGVGYPLRVSTAADGSGSTIASPINIGVGVVTSVAVTISAGVTLRQALEQLMPALLSLGQLFNGFYGFAITVDFWGNLRIWYIVTDPTGVFIGQPTDYQDIIVSSVSGTKRPADGSHKVTRGTTSHQVRVVGGNAAGSGVVSDGTGLIGPIAVINDSNSTSADMKASIATNYLVAQGAYFAEGSFTLEETQNIGTSGGQARAGSNLYLTDAQLGLTVPPLNTTFTVPVAQIQKEFLANGNENWTISYGFQVRSGAQMLRRLTRGTLS